MASFKNILFAASAMLSFTTPALAHMELVYPLPINSKFAPDAGSNPKTDYTMTAPLLADGSNFPCKGYQNGPIKTTATFAAGSQHNITVAGSATHGGGSCQISLSYDNGQTFRVIQSIIGSCPLVDSYDFTVPSFAPAGEALLAWTWFNKIGNREMYMNCAWVDIASSAPAKRQLRNSAKFRRQSSTPSSMNDLPEIYRANTGAGTPTTVEGQDQIFPNPGPSVQYGDNTADSPTSSSSSSSSSCDTTITSFATYIVTVSGTSTFTPTTATTAADDSTTTMSFAPTSTSAAVSSSSSALAVTSTTIAITAPASTPSSTAPTSAPTTAPTTVPTSAPTMTPSESSSDGTFTTANGGACPSGQMGSMKCTNNGQSFSICNWGVWTNMGSVAAGTQCTGSDGEASIVAAGSAPSSSSDSSSSSSSSSCSESESETGYGTTSSNSSDSSDTTATDASGQPGACGSAAMGSLKCTNGGQGWAMCNWSTWQDMGSVAAGTQCVGDDGQGQMVAA